MTRIFIPLILIAAAIGLFVLYINPTYQQIKGVQSQGVQYDDALSKVQQLQGLRQQLLTKSNAFSQSDVDKLQQILPDNVDNIRLIIDVNNIASRYNLSLSNLKLATASNSSTTGGIAAVGSSGNPVGSAELGFSVTTNYDTFMAFLQDLEHSERIVDITQLSFQNGTGNTTTYTITFRTYWLY